MEPVVNLGPHPGTLEWWHIIVSISASIVGLGLVIFGKGFTAWSNKLSEMSERFDNRLSHMEKTFNERQDDLEKKMVLHESRIHDLHIQVERRVTFIEASLVNTAARRNRWIADRSEPDEEDA